MICFYSKEQSLHYIGVKTSLYLRRDYQVSNKKYLLFTSYLTLLTLMRFNLEIYLSSYIVQMFWYLRINHESGHELVAQKDRKMMWYIKDCLFQIHLRFSPPSCRMLVLAKPIQTFSFQIHFFNFLHLFTQISLLVGLSSYLIYFCHVQFYFLCHPPTSVFERKLSLVGSFLLFCL